MHAHSRPALSRPACTCFSFVDRRSPMFTITRQTPMLRGVSVVCGGQTAWMRLGGEDRVRGETPMFPISMRHPSPSSADLNQPTVRPNRVHEHDADDAVGRAGRSDCFAGVLVRHSPALRARLVSGRPQTLEARSSSAGGLSLPDAIRTGTRSQAKPAGYTPAGGTRFAAATRGRGVA